MKEWPLGTPICTRTTRRQPYLKGGCQRGPGFSTNRLPPARRDAQHACREEPRACGFTVIRRNSTSAGRRRCTHSTHSTRRTLPACQSPGCRHLAAAASTAASAGLTAGIAPAGRLAQAPISPDQAQSCNVGLRQLEALWGVAAVGAALMAAPLAMVVCHLALQRCAGAPVALRRLRCAVCAPPLDRAHVAPCISASRRTAPTAASICRRAAASSAAAEQPQLDPVRVSTGYCTAPINPGFPAGSSV